MASKPSHSLPRLSLAAAALLAQGSLLASCIVTSQSPALAGIPSSEKTWMQANPNWVVNTEDVEIDGTHIRLWVQRTASTDDSKAGDSWTGKYRISCYDLHSRIEPNSVLWQRWPFRPWEKIKPDDFGWELANQLCFLTGVKGYTKEANPPAWAKKIISKFQK